jgi:hypothetical protein
MSIAAGGKIKQSIIPDVYPDHIWRTDMAEIFNFQIVNSVQFGEITRVLTPPSPISYDTYVAAGIPFFGWTNEPNSTISGHFHGVKSLAKLGTQFHGDWDWDWDSSSSASESCDKCKSVCALIRCVLSSLLPYHYPFRNTAMK